MQERARYLSVPYGHGDLDFIVQPHFDLDTVESGTVVPVADLAAETRRVLGAPLGSPALRDGALLPRVLPPIRHLAYAGFWSLLGAFPSRALPISGFVPARALEAAAASTA